MIQITRNAAGGDICMLARPNRSLSRNVCLRIFALIGASCLGVGVLAAWFAGAWLVLPFAGLEVLLLAWAVCMLRKHDGDYDRVCVGPDQIDIERREARTTEHAVLNRHWARLVVRAGHGAGRLAWRSHGQEHVFDRFMTDEERETVAEVMRPWRM